MTDNALNGLKLVIKDIVKEALLEILQEQTIKVDASKFDEIVDEKTMAIIAASAEAVYGKNIKIKKVQFLNTKGIIPHWSVSGRNDVMASHNVSLKGN